jgi:hypothetical protein
MGAHFLKKHPCFEILCKWMRKEKMCLEDQEERLRSMQISMEAVDRIFKKPPCRIGQDARRRCISYFYGGRG